MHRVGDAGVAQQPVGNAGIEPVLVVGVDAATEQLGRGRDQDRCGVECADDDLRTAGVMAAK